MELTTKTLDLATLVTIMGDLDGSSAPRALDEISRWTPMADSL